MVRGTAVSEQIERPEVEVAVASDRPGIVLAGWPWTGQTTVLEQIVRRLVRGGMSPERIVWAELGHPRWHGSTPASLAASLGEHGVVLLDDLPAEHLDDVRSWQGPVRIIATTSRAPGPSDIPLAPWTVARLAQLDGLALPALSAHPDSLIAGTFQLHGRSSVETLRRALVVGGFPALRDVGRSDLARSLVPAQREVAARVLDTTLYKRIPRDFAVRAPADVERLLVAVAGQVGRQLSSARLAEDLGLTQPTVDKYLGVLEQSGLIALLPNWSGPDESKRRGRRVYFPEGAVRSAALRLGARPLSDPEELGMLLVNAVAAHAAMWGKVSNVTVGHWRAGRREVDLVLDHPDAPLALQIGSSRRQAEEGLRAFERSHPRFAGRCWLLLHRALPTWPAHHPSGIGRLPLVPFLLGLGAAIHAACKNPTNRA